MEILLSNRDFSTVIDDEDYPLVYNHKWRAGGSNDARYVVASIDRRVVLMHRLIMDAQSGEEVDHIDGDGFNNRRSSNLRLCSHSQNGKNHHHPRGSSQFLGVSWDNLLGKWRAQIGIDGKTKYIGVFENEEDAARIRDQVAKELFGEFANLNFHNKKGTSSK